MELPQEATKEIVLTPEKPTTALDVRPMNGPQLGGMVFQSHSELVERASEIATVLSKIIEQKKLFDNVQGKKHVRVEGWTTLLAMMGIVPVEKSSVRLPDGAYESYVDLLRTRDGQIVGGASSFCGMDEIWGERKEYARKSMATTRATGKAARLGYSWIMVLAGYQPTPLEEMPEQQQGSQAAADAVAQRKVAAAKPVNYSRTLWVKREVFADKGPMLALTGYHHELQEFLGNCFGYPHPEDKKAWLLAEDYEQDLHKICREKNITLIDGLAPASGATEPSPATPQAVAPVLSSYNQPKNMKFCAVKWGETECTTFDEALWPFLKLGQGKPAVLVLKENRKGDKVYHNIVAIKSIGGKEFDMDTKNFVIQRHDDAGPY